MNVRRDAHGGRPDVIESDGRGLHLLVGSASLPRGGGDFLSCGDLLQHSSLPFARRCRPCVRRWNDLSCPDVMRQYTPTRFVVWGLSVTENGGVERGGETSDRDIQRCHG